MAGQPRGTSAHRQGASSRTDTLSSAQRAYLQGGLSQPGGRLPLFDTYGGKYDAETIRACLRQGYCEAWFANPMKPDWMVCRLTEKGYSLFR